MSDLLSLFLKKEQHEQFAYDSSELFAKNEKFVQFFKFLTVFHFLCLMNSSRRSSLFHYFLENDLSDSLTSVFTKKQPWENCSHGSLKKSSCELRLLFKKSERLHELIVFLSESLFRSPKTSGSLEKPKIEFPTLHYQVSMKTGR